MKAKVVIATIILLTALFTGCGNNDEGNNDNNNNQPTPTTQATTDETGDVDVVTTASIVNEEDAFLNAISTNGTWIICLLNDLTIDQELVLDGEFKNGKQDADGKDIIQRKIALYTQDENRNVTARFTLTAPSLTVKSPNARIQSGTFKGDLIIDADNFELVDTTVEGNVYFTSQDIQDTFTMDETSKVSGTQGLQEQE